MLKKEGVERIAMKIFLGLPISCDKPQNMVHRRHPPENMVLGIFQFAMRQTSSIAMVVHLLARDGSFIGLDRVTAIGQYSIISIDVNDLSTKKYFIFY